MRRIRLLIATSAALAVGIATLAGSASARTVYDYAYSGTYFDGSGAGKAFDSAVSGLDLDSANDVFYVANGNEPGSLTKITSSGVGIDFPATGTPRLKLESGYGVGDPRVAVDRYGGENDGNIYVNAGFFLAGFEADGTKLPGLINFTMECGAVPTYPTGDTIFGFGSTGVGLNGIRRVGMDGVVVSTDSVGEPGLEPGTRVPFFPGTCYGVFDSKGFVYAHKGGSYYGGEGNGRIFKITGEGTELYEVNDFSDSRGIAVDSSNDDVFIVRGNNTFEAFDKEGHKLGSGWGTASGGYEGLAGSPVGIAVDPDTHDVWIANRRVYPGGVSRVEKFERVNPHIIPDSRAIKPDYSHPTGETIGFRGIVNPDGVATTDCHFEYGPTQEFGSSTPCLEGDVFTGSTDQVVTSVQIPFPKGHRYYFRLSTKNANNELAHSNRRAFIPQGMPKLLSSFVDRVKTDGARFGAEFDTNGGNASFHVEYGEEGEPLSLTTPESDSFGFTTTLGQHVYEPGVYSDTVLAPDLKPGTTYEYRVVVSNEAGDLKTPIAKFRTFDPDAGVDDCDNALARRQSGSSLLIDCRGYELVSFHNSGGVDVVSDIVPLQTPLDAYPRASDSILFSMHVGIVPGLNGSPTNLGRDPYIARRGPNGWKSEYVGLPADGMAEYGAFGSPLLGADPMLEQFAFGGKDICDPCFPDGSINLPLRKANGELVKGMAGTFNPAADPSGEVRKPLSADGGHLVFGTDQKFEPAGLEGATSIYDRNLTTNVTQVVSTMPNGATMTGQLAQLDISSDGERVLVGRLVGADADGNRYFDLYMHEGSSPNSVTVADTANGVLFNGMTSDGTKVFFTTRDALAGDSDTSADFYRADVGTVDPAPVTRVSTGTGGAGNSDSCTPVTGWNAVSGGPDCSVVGIAGGGGVSPEDGTAYFISPEQLDGAGNGEADQPNLYVLTRGSAAPHYVGLLDSSAYKPPPVPPSHKLADANFTAGLNATGELAVDQNTGEVYVTERGGTNRVSRFTASGAPSPFSSLGSNKLTGQSLGGEGEGQIAVDSANSSPFKGALYVTTNGGSVRVYANNGEKLGEITGFGEACGVSVDQANGDVYVGNYSSNIYRFKPISAAAPVTNASYQPQESINAPDSLCNIDAQSPGFVYDWSYGGGGIKQYPKSAFGVAPGSPTGTPIGNGIHAQTDPQSGDLYVNEQTKVSRYASDGTLLETFGKGAMAGSRGVAINQTNKDVFVTTGTGIQRYDFSAPVYDPIDSLAVEHGVHQNGVHSFGDFQVTPEGKYAAFASDIPLTGYPNFGKSHVFRYDADVDELVCASCSPALAVTKVDTSLPPYGLALTDDGRVFYTTLEALVLRDTNERLDAYEWSDGVVELISPGIAPYDASLATVSADGKNAFFFTRQVLTHEDESGNAVKLYVAREGGGVANDPERKPCAASDECHGDQHDLADERRQEEDRLQEDPGETARQVRQEAWEDAEGEEKAEDEEMSKERTTMSSHTSSGPGAPMRRLLRRATLAGVAALSAAGILSAPASASQEITEFTVASASTQAGGHGDFITRLRLANAGSPEVAKSLTFELPAGVFGNPGAIVRCRAEDFVVNHCAPGSQVGVVTVNATYENVPNTLLGTAPLYNVETTGDEETARLAFVLPIVNAPISVPIGVRASSDYGLSTKFAGITQSIALSQLGVTIWAFPAAESNDDERFPPGTPGAPPGCPGEASTACNPAPYPEAGIVVRPYLDNPSLCTGAPLKATVAVVTYQDPKPSTATADYPATTGCENQKFDPVFNLEVTSSEADQPSGLDVQLKANQFLEGTSPSPSTLRAAKLVLPEGLTINPDAADGQTACSDADAGFGTNQPGNCPDNSKIGTMEVKTPALERPLNGSLYIGEPKPGDQYRAFMIFDGFGIHAKLFASFQPDPQTGQLTVAVENIPQVPFEEFNLHLFASDRGLVATPTRCAIYRASSHLTPWNPQLAPQNSEPIIAVTSGPNGSRCPGLIRPFSPRLAAGTTSLTAGDFSSFILKLDRDDGDQFLGDLTFKMPPGFTGNLRGIGYCPEASIVAAAQNLGRVEQVSPSCPASSQIGTTNVAAGPGEHPFNAVGRMYLSGRFKGAPLSLAAVTPALAGPYDYGVVVVRVALHVDPLTAQVYAASDTVPSIIGGIPIRMRSIRVNIDKPNFTINPTNCSPFTVDSQGIGDQDTVTDFSSYFQVANCARLPFKPKMTVKQIGKKSRRAQNPVLQFDLRTRPGDANIKALSVTLSHAFEIDQRHLGNICSEKELAANQCAGRTPIGKATTTTPLLDQPLAGPAYAVSGSGGLPKLAFILNGQVNLVPRADTTTVGGRLKTTVPVVPDAPIGHFRLTVFGGKSGYLINTRDTCVHTPVNRVAYTGQNGKTRTESVKVKVACGKSKSRVRRHAR